MIKTLPLSAALLFLSVISTVTLKANDTLTRAQVYNFNVGDTFDYKQTNESNLVAGVSEVFYRIVVDSKYYSQNNDTLFYLIRRIDSEGVTQQTLSIANPNDYELYQNMSVQPGFVSDTTGARIKNIITHAYFGGGVTEEFTEGLGRTFYSSNTNDEGYNAQSTEELIYYSISGERNGTPILNSASLLHYTPLPEECAVWTDVIYSDFPAQNQTGIVEQIQSGNKVGYDGHTYVEMIYRSYNYQNNQFTPDSLIGYYRNDTAGKKALFYSSLTNVAFLQYDFNHLCAAPNCLSQVLVGNQLRTQWPGYIEGLGGTKGLVPVKQITWHPPGTPPPFLLTNQGKLTSFCVCNQLLYAPDTLATCSLLTGIDPIQAPILSFVVNPNPANSFIAVSTHANLPNGTVTIADITGRVIRTAKLATEKTEIPADFPSGLYFVTLSNGQQSITKKLIVSK